MTYSKKRYLDHMVKTLAALHAPKTAPFIFINNQGFGNIFDVLKNETISKGDQFKGLTKASYFIISFWALAGLSAVSPLWPIRFSKPQKSSSVAFRDNKT